MKKIGLFIMLSTVFWVNAQSYIGFLTDNYSGVHGVIANPASIADSRYKVDFNVAGVSAFAGNDFYGLNVFDALENGYDLNSEASKTIRDQNNFGFNVDVLGPSLLFNINPKNSVALFSRVRSFININGLRGEAIDILQDDIVENKIIDQGPFNLSTNNWLELGASYAKVLSATNSKYFLKGGISVKYLKGYFGGYGYNQDDIRLEFDNENQTELGSGTTVTTVTAVGAFNTTTSIDLEMLDEFNDVFNDYETIEKSEGTGIGIDLGFVYELRPDYQNYENNPRNVNKYKFKLGVSVTDIGNISYNNGYAYEYDLDLDSSEIDDVDELDEFIDEAFTEDSRSNESYKMKLPTALHINADYNFNGKFYMNLNTDLAMVSKDKLAVNSISSLVSLTPRFESKWVSVYMPFSVVQYNGFQVGAGLRAGPVYVGSGSVITNLISSNSRGADVYMGLKIPIYHSGRKNDDKDNDGVTDKLDACPEVAGPSENNGCPWDDQDKDGVLDNEDKCIQRKGPKENDGCPWGDRDDDEVLDNVDECPDLAGPKRNKGCLLDSDKDGVYNVDDKCPKKPGPKENNGCPWKDQDKDGVLDNVDKCPMEPGTAEREGCPEPKSLAPIEAEKLKELQSFAKAIYFNSGQATFRPGVSEKLELIGNIMKEYPNANFAIEGHTDSQGSATTNKSLSDRRARAVRNYLVRIGIPESRLSSIGYGEDYPIASNETRDGRAQNRRVEIILRK